MSSFLCSSSPPCVCGYGKSPVFPHNNGSAVSRHLADTRYACFIDARRLTLSHCMCVLPARRWVNSERIKFKHFGQVVVTVELDSRSDRAFFRVLCGFAISLLLIVSAPTAGCLPGAAALLALQIVCKLGRCAVNSHMCSPENRSLFVSFAGVLK
jgi:hypothetical protein